MSESNSNRTPIKNRGTTGKQRSKLSKPNRTARRVNTRWSEEDDE